MYIMPSVNHLTRQEQFVLVSVLGLLLVGVAVRVYRASHPGVATVTVAVSANDSLTNKPAEPKE